MNQNPSPSSADYNRIQKDYFETTIKPTMIPRDTPYLRRHVEKSLQLACYRDGERVLEAGCGMGRYTLLLAQMGVRVAGSDLSQILLDRLQAFNGGRFDIPLHCADLERMPSDLNGTFDIVLGYSVLHHVHDLERTFVSLARILKPGGRIVFLEPNPLNPFYYIQIATTPRMTWQGEKGLLRMRPEIIRRAMGSAGLKKFTLDRFGLFPPILANNVLGGEIEKIVERVRLWQAFLPFQIFVGEQNSK